MDLTRTQSPWRVWIATWDANNAVGHGQQAFVVGPRWGSSSRASSRPAPRSRSAPWVAPSAAVQARTAPLVRVREVTKGQRAAALRWAPMGAASPGAESKIAGGGSLRDRRSGLQALRDGQNAPVDRHHTMPIWIPFCGRTFGARARANARTRARYGMRASPHGLLPASHASFVP